MNMEHERKFLVRGDTWDRGYENVNHIVQGYLSVDPERCVRVRTSDNHAYMTVKGKSDGCSRHEFEFEIPVWDANQLLKLCIDFTIDKYRFTVNFGEDRWVIDEFKGWNAGLLMAEIELKNPDQQFQRPPWLGKEVTSDPRYYNMNLCQRPYFFSIKEQYANLG